MDNNDEKVLDEDSKDKPEVAVETKNDIDTFEQRYSDIKQSVKDMDEKNTPMLAEVELIRKSLSNGISSAVEFDAKRTIEEQLEGAKRQREVLAKQQQLLNDLQNKIAEANKSKGGIPEIVEDAAREEI